jgi:hypothetical protein
MRKKYVTQCLLTSLLFSFFFSFSAFSQHYNYPLNGYSRYFLEAGDSTSLSSFQSLPESLYHLDNVWGFRPELYYTKAGNTLNNDHLLSIEKEDLQVYVDVLLNFEVGTEIRNSSDYIDTTLLFRNMRGFSVKGNIGEKISFETSFRETQSSLPEYLYLYTGVSDVVPGTGRVKPFNGTAFDHNMAQGYVSCAVNSHLNIQFGSQKNFIGSGYRSMLLSDNSFTYPQLKISTSFMKGKIRYHVIHAWLQTLERLPRGDTPESIFKAKGASFKYLEIRPLEMVSIGIFEGFIWDRFNTEKGTVPFPAYSYIPILGVNSAIIGLDSEQNGIMGLDLLIRPMKGLRIFGQYALDGENKDAYQVGFRTTDLLFKGLTIGVEYNEAGTSTYATSSTDASYTHYGQPLAHPMGNGFKEVHAELMYFYERIFLDARYTMADQSSLKNGNYAGDQLYTALSDNGYNLESISLKQIDLRFGYFFNPKSNFNVYAGWMFREQMRFDNPQPYNMFKFGIEMSLINRYEDF